LVRLHDGRAGRLDEFISIYEFSLEPAHLATYTQQRLAGRAVRRRRQDSRPGSSINLEGRMATAVKRETRRDTNISLDKPIYTISVASEILETHPRTLMMYEHLGLVVPKRTSTNRRRFSQRDVMKLQTIQKLTRQHSVNLAGVRYIMKLLKLLHESELPAPVELRDIDVSQLDV
jgi:DNA-binding transcriptional MerR regulator